MNLILSRLRKVISRAYVEILYEFLKIYDSIIFYDLLVIAKKQ